MRILKDLRGEIEGRDVLVVEDIVDTGHTLKHVLEILGTRRPARLEVCALLDKPSRREVDVKAKWIGFEIPDKFVVGYGIDYAQRNRNLPHIGAVRFRLRGLTPFLRCTLYARSMHNVCTEVAATVSVNAAQARALPTSFQRPGTTSAASASLSASPIRNGVRPQARVWSQAEA